VPLRTAMALASTFALAADSARFCETREPKARYKATKQPTRQWRGLRRVK